MRGSPNPEVAILNAALELPAAERAAYLDKASAGDAALRARVEELLRSHERAGNFLETPPAGSDFTRTVRVEIPLTEKAGDRIGRYKLLQQIGEGGCGVVYMAEQEEPVRRRVALKVIKLGMDTKSVIARFEAERQALALMDHPNIAKVLDAGATDTGRPYFVMELVRGIKITDYCDQNKLSTRERLDLFVQICRAIQHAHQKGVIHRDIKPSNILVTINDGVPVPKVIDFGIAKATQGRLTDKTLFTAFEQFIGTPAYMSPEQAEMTSLDIDTRSDIYSLGVLLYELLTGKTPFDAKELFQAGLDEMRRTIREQEPQKPSTRLSTMLDAERTMTAKHRQTEAPKLIHLVRGDLDWIAMKCLEKDRVRRYETANGLAADIQRHLNDEPVVARPPSKLYEFQKTVRRHKFGFAAAGAVMAALALGLAVSTREFLREKQSLQRAVTAESKEKSLRENAEQSLQRAVAAEREEKSQRERAEQARNEADTARANESKMAAERQARLEITRAGELIRNKNYFQAEEVLNAIAPVYLTENADVASCRRAIAWDWVTKLEWEAAADRLAVLIREDGSVMNSENATDYGAYAGALVQTGRIAEYEKFRRSLFTRYATDDEPSLSEYLCAIAMLAPADPEVGKVMAGRYDITKNRVKHSEEGSQWPEAERRYAMALTEYRLGNFREAAPLCASALTLPSVASNFISTGLALNALVQHQLNDQEDARMALTLCHRLVDPAMRNGPKVVNVTGFGAWWVWLMSAALQREADALMGAPTASDYERLAEARAKLGEAEKFGTNILYYDAARSNYDNATQLAAAVPAVVQRMDGKKFVKLVTALGIWGLQHHEWREAVTNWSLVVYGPSRNGSLLFGPDLSNFYLSYAPLLVELDDGEEYERFRANAIETFGETRLPVNADRILEACLLRPADEKLMTALTKLGALLVTTPTAPNGPPAGDLTLALFKYRNGDPAGALESVRINLDQAANTPFLAARARLLSALCLARTGKLNEAKAEIDPVRDTVDDKFNSPPISEASDLVTWHGWWVDHILLREADALIQNNIPGQVPMDNPNPPK